MFEVFTKKGFKQAEEYRLEKRSSVYMYVW